MSSKHHSNNQSDCQKIWWFIVILRCTFWASCIGNVPLLNKTLNSQLCAPSTTTKHGRGDRAQRRHCLLCGVERFNMHQGRQRLLLLKDCASEIAATA